MGDNAKDKAKSIFDSLNNIKGTSLEERIGDSQMKLEGEEGEGNQSNQGVQLKTEKQDSTLKTETQRNNRNKLKTEMLEEEQKQEDEEEDESVEEQGTKYVNKVGNTVKKKDNSDDKISKRKREILKQIRKDDYEDTKVKVDSEEEEDDDSREVEDTEVEVNTDESNSKSNKDDIDIQMTEDELAQLEEVMKALRVPDEIMEAFESESYREVFNYLEEEHDIKFQNEIEQDMGESTDRSNESTDKESKDTEDTSEQESDTKVKVKSENVFDLKEGVKLAVLNDNFATADRRKWDKSLVVYESNDDMELEFKGNYQDDLAKFRLRLEEESIDKEIYLDREEVNQILK